MLERKEIDRLPSVPIENYRSLPSESGIYFAIDSQNNIQYIGKSVNLKSRWGGHHKHADLAAIEGVRIAYLVADKDIIEEIEQALIAWFNPPLNNVVVLHEKGKNRRICDSVTLSLTPEEKAELEQLALELGELWGNKPNVSQLIRAIAVGKYRIVSAESPEAMYIDKLRSAVSQAKSALRKVEKLI